MKTMKTINHDTLKASDPILQTKGFRENRCEKEAIRDKRPNPYQFRVFATETYSSNTFWAPTINWNMQ